MRATPDLSTVTWHKSSYSGNAEGSACVEVADGVPGLTPVRDSKTPLAPALLFTSNTWGAFVTAVKRGTDLIA
ncbi:DUF397 domain-containing protein [Streptomyces sp. NPDC014892]|uniref:DUF397 domain-containing protein n=1 Tax=Streptomyces sp. NPDC014892 TaxID=3364930 RepID=UPI0036FA796A